MKKCKFITAENSELTLENKKMTYCGVISHLKWYKNMDNIIYLLQLHILIILKLNKYFFF
ncbi:hypothetical protein DFH84_001812 [Clostridium saccharobutylicum]|nr:hypothetical protein [Clostridium saccharobutylicum]